MSVGMRLRDGWHERPPAGWVMYALMTARSAAGGEGRTKKSAV